LKRTQDIFNLSTAGGLLAILLWSTTFALARSLSEQVGPITGAAAVYLIGGLLCLPRWCVPNQRASLIRGLSWRYVLGCGFLFAFYTVLTYVAVGLAKNREQLLEVALVNYLWPAATILLSIPLLGLKCGPMLFPGTLLALSGVFLVMTQESQVTWRSFWDHWRGNPGAYLLPFFAALSWALYSNLARRWTKPEAGGAVELFVPVTGLVFLTIRFVRPETTAWTPRAMCEAVLLGAITAVAYFLWDAAMRKGNLLLVASCSYFTPLLSTLFSCLYLQVVPSSRIWVGTILIVVGSLLSWRSVSAVQTSA
jgi:drug/metabolite transporter (DMT)-like permease